MFLTKLGKLTQECPGCKKNFNQVKGPTCLVICPEKQLEIKHQKMLPKIVAYCLPKEKIVLECPSNLSAHIAKSKG